MIFEFFIIAIDLAFTCLITNYLIPVGNYYHYWAPFLLLIAGYLIGLAIVFILFAIYGSFFKKDKDYEKPSYIALWWLNQAIKYIDYHARAKVKVEYVEPFPEGRFLLVCNHLSRFDPMVLADKFSDKQMVFISKPSNFNIPIGGHLMKRGCYMAIVREDKLKSLQTINEAIRLIQKDYVSVGISPEGTRGKDPSYIAEFHEGIFAVATKNNVPIVVTTIQGAENIVHNFPWKRTKVKIKVLKVIYPNQYQGMTVKAISDYTRNLMQEDIKKEN